MASKNINILMKLTDQFTKPMLKATNATRSQANAMKAANLKATNFVKNANSKFLSLAKTIGKATLALGGLAAAFAVVGLKRFAAESIELANAQIEAETKLEAALKNVDSIAAGGTENIKKAKAELLGVASEIQKIGVIGDEVVIAGMQQLATYGMTEKQIAALAPGMADLLAQQKGMNASQEDAVAYAKALGKAMNGSTDSLKRYGIVMDDAQKKAFQMANEEERAAMLADLLEKRVGGVNAELAKTPAGQIKQTQNAWGDMMEEIGKRLVPIKAQLYSFVGQYIPDIQKAAMKFMDWLQPNIDKFISWFQGHTGDIKDAIKTIGNILKKVWKVIKPLLNFVVEHASTIIKIIAAIAAAWAAINIVMKIKAAIDMISMVVSVMGPIPLIIAAIIIVLILVIKNWDKIKAKVIEVANKIKAKLQPLINWIKTAFDNVKTKVCAVWDAIKTKVETVVNKIKDIVSKVKEAIIKGWDKVKTAVGNIFDGPLAAAQKLYDLITRLISKLKEYKELLSSGSLPTTGSTSGYVWPHATGTSYWKGGATRINEGGRGEIVDLPNGTRIIPHDVAKNNAGGTTVNVNLTVAGNVIGNREFMEATGEYVSTKVISALGVV